jgi:hypothetical protein
MERKDIRAGNWYILKTGIGNLAVKVQAVPDVGPIPIFTLGSEVVGAIAEPESLREIPDLAGIVDQLAKQMKKAG